MADVKMVHLHIKIDVVKLWHLPHLGHRRFRNANLVAFKFTRVTWNLFLNYNVKMAPKGFCIQTLSLRQDFSLRLKSVI